MNEQKNFHDFYMEEKRKEEEEKKKKRKRRRKIVWSIVGVILTFFVFMMIVGYIASTDPKYDRPKTTTTALPIQIPPTPTQTTWEKTFGGKSGDYALSVQPTRDGGYIVAGMTASFGSIGFDVYLLKLDSEGNKIWEKAYGGKSNVSVESIQPTRDGGYIAAGWTDSFGAGKNDVYLLKLDSEGNKIWEKAYGGKSNDYAFSVQPTADGGYIVAGMTASFGSIGFDVYLLKLDSEGNKIWEKALGGEVGDAAYSVQPTADGGYIVAGETYSYFYTGDGGWDVYLLKLDSDGNKIWEKALGGEGDDIARSVQSTADGGYIVAGETDSFGAGRTDVYLLKLDSDGNKIWEKTYGGESWDSALSVQSTADGGYIVAGSTDSFGAGGKDVYLLKLDSDGNKIWEKALGGEGDDIARSVHSTADGGYIVAGWTDSFGAGDLDIYLLKLDSDGNTKPSPAGVFGQEKIFLP